MKLREGPELVSLLGYQVQMANLRLMENARAALAPFGISPAKVTALLLIRANPGCDQTTLGRALSVNRSGAMKLVNSLAALDLIERRAGRNLRTNALHLTTTGEAMAEEVAARLHKSEQAMAADLSEAEQAMLFHLLAKVRRKGATPAMK